MYTFVKVELLYTEMVNIHFFSITVKIFCLCLN